MTRVTAKEKEVVILLVDDSSLEARLTIKPIHDENAPMGTPTLEAFYSETSKARPILEALYKTIAFQAGVIWQRCEEEKNGETLAASARILKDQAPLTLWPTTLILFIMLASFAWASFAAQKRNRNKLAALLLLCTTLAFLLLSTEIFFRLTKNQWRAAISTGRNCYPSNPRGYFQERILPNGERIYCAFGLKRMEAECKALLQAGWPSAKRAHIVALGDSFTQALGVRYEEAWPKRLEEIRPQWRAVANCGRLGDNVSQVLRRMRSIADSVNADWFIYGYVLNDPPHLVDYETVREGEIGFQYESAERLNETIKRYNPFGVWASRSALLRFLAERLAIHRLTKGVIESYRKTYQTSVTKPIAETLETIETMNNLAQKAEGRLLVVLFPLFYRLDDYPFQKAHALMRKALQARGIETLDLLPVFEEMDAEALIVHPSDRHPNEIAHKLIAEAIDEKLIELSKGK